MGAFFSGMNLARWVILLSIVASVALAWSGWDFHQRRIEVEDSLETQVPNLARSVQVKSRELTRLIKERDRAGFRGGIDDPQYYIRQIAARDKIKLGQVDIRFSEKSPAKDVIDRIYTITPPDRKEGYERSNIANFLYTLEQDSRRLRVTHVRMEPADQRIKPEDIPEDSWTYEIEVISREKVSDEG